jgi:hypothetical protein
MVEQARAQVQRPGGNGHEPTLVIESVLVPRPAAHEVLVKVSHVGQNPTDGEFCNMDGRPRRAESDTLQCSPLIPMPLVKVRFWDATLLVPSSTWAKT